MKTYIENIDLNQNFYRRVLNNYYDLYKQFYIAELIVDNMICNESYYENTLSINIKKRLTFVDNLFNGKISYIEGRCLFIPPKPKKNNDTNYKYIDFQFNEYLELYNIPTSTLINLSETIVLDYKQIENSYETGEINAICMYFSDVIRNSFYYVPLPQNKGDFLVKYFTENKLFYCELQLPQFDETPDIKDFTINSDGTIKQKFLSTKEIKKLYEKMIYSIIIRTIKELFQLDYKNYIDIISINGKVKRINPSTGLQVNNCILSIQTNKTEFSKINPLQVDPQSCFKYLKGISGIDLSNYVPIKPIFQVQKDKRTVDSYEVELSSVTNLAAMNWEDFEHLIRALFEKEFSENGGEVKVTRASRDGGVDAIAFDPDPIKGGKIVIQAKRYTNIVGVSAVRDLYGTVLNEGANKGILVTTSDYGSDSYEFIKGKPLTLLNGNNLLYLLEKHGQKARIDIQEAREYFKNME